MRAVIRKAQGQQQQKKPEPNDLYCTSVGGNTDVSYLPHMPSYGSRLSNGSSLAGGHFSNLASRMCNKPMDDSDLGSSKSCPENGAYSLLNNDVEMPLTSAIDQRNITPPVENLSDAQADKMLIENPNLPSFLLQNEHCSDATKSANSMLLSMLNDVPSATPSSCASGLLTKPRKRKASDGRNYSFIGRSPKRKMSEESSSNHESLNIDGSSSDNTPGGVDKNSGLPLSFSPSDSESPHMVRAPASVEPYVKNDLPSFSYPQRSASTDSYLSFRPQQVISGSENSNPEMSGIISHIKSSSHFAGDSDQQGSDSNLELDSETCSTDKSLFAEKLNCPDKTIKKLKKTKEVSDTQEITASKTQELDVSECSSSSDFFHKSATDDNIVSEDSSSGSKASNFGNIPKPVVISPNLKIAKTTDGHKVSKSESKMKQKEGRRSGEGTSGKKKSDGKKERKRKQTAEGAPNRISSHLIQSADASLMPPPTSSSSAEVSSSSGCDVQSKRPITLNMKTSPGSSQSKSLVAISSTSSHPTNNPLKSNFSKSGVDKSNVKLSSRMSQSITLSKTANSLRDGEQTKNVVSASLKLPTKHKQSSSTKSSGSSHSSGQSSPSKNKPTTLKLKNTNLSHLPSATAIVKSCPQIISSSAAISIAQSLSDEPVSPTGKQGSSSSKSHKSQLRSGKGSLSAVIDKLKLTATNAQQFPENMRPNSGMVEKKESKLERKEGVKDSKEGQATKPNESKNKYCSSDQFTVKQSSGIKLTVTKTRCDGSSKSDKVKSSSTKVDSGGTTNPNKSSNSGTNITKKPTGTTQVSVKKSNISSTNLHTNSSHKTIRCNTTNPSKAVVVTGHKVISPGGTSTYHKVISSTVKALKPNKVSSVLQQNKKKVPHVNESKCVPVNDVAVKSSSSIVNVPAKVIASLPTSKLTSSSNSSWPVSNILKQNEEQYNSQRFSHNDVIDEADKETTFRFLLEQSKNEGQNGSEQAVPSSKPSDFAVQQVQHTKVEIENKDFTVTSSTDTKRSTNVFRLNQVHTNTSEPNLSIVSDIKPTIIQSDNVTTKKHEVNVNTILVNSSEQVNQGMSAFSIAVKPSDCLNMHSDDESSPEDGLIIDYPGTPRTSEQKRCLQSKKKESISPDQKKGRIDTIMVDKIAENFDYPQNTFISKPLEQLSPSTSNHSHTIPLESWPLDDDLMNMALTMGK